MLRKVDKILLRDYLRSLGLTSVVGSMSGFFLKPHGVHQVIYIMALFAIGTIFSYFGLAKRKGDE